MKDLDSLIFDCFRICNALEIPFLIIFPLFGMVESQRSGDIAKRFETLIKFPLQPD